MYISKHFYLPIPPLTKAIQLDETAAAADGAFAPVRVVAIALNTAHLDPQAAQQVIAQIQTETKLQLSYLVPLQSALGQKCC